MKKQPFSVLRYILIACLSFIFISPVAAQKEKEHSLITQDQVNKINEIVKPLKDQFGKQLSQDKAYAAYQDDARKITEAKTIAEKRSLTAKLEGKYSAFFQKLWSAAKVDEKAYQEKIRAVFPERIGKHIEFGSYLSFSLIVSSVVERVSPLPERQDKCIDICPIATCYISGSSTLIAGGGVNYGNCFLKTNAWSAVLGWNSIDGDLNNNITIPGAFPDDTRKLRVKKSYELKEEATSFALPGGGYAVAGLDTYQTSESLTVIAPLFWLSHKTYTKTISEEYVLEKRDIAKSIFHTYAGVFAYIVSGSWGFTECTSIKWSICEEK